MALGNVMNAFETVHGGLKISLLLDGMPDLSRHGGPTLDADVLLRFERISEGKPHIREGSTMVPSRTRAYDILQYHAGRLADMGG